MRCGAFTYGLDGQILEVGDAFNALRHASESIPAEITVITGITDEMVAGKVIDPALVETFIAPAALVIAHNASFDRRLLERFCPGFVTKPWGCSMTQVAWAGQSGHDEEHHPAEAFALEVRISGKWGSNLGEY